MAITEVVRLGKERAKQLDDVASQIGNRSISSIVEDALDLWMVVEAPVEIANTKDKRKRRESLAKRQDVILRE